MIIVLVILLVLVETNPLIVADSNAGVFNDDINSETKRKTGGLSEGRRMRVGQYCYNRIIILAQKD